MKARRFYSSRDKNLALSFQCNKAQMGSRIAGGALNIEIEATDADNETFARIELLKNGTVVQAWTPNATHPQVTTTQTGRQGDDFCVRVYQSGTWTAISSPIFITSSSADVTPPLIATLSPADGAPGVAAGAALVATRIAATAITDVAGNPGGLISREQFTRVVGEDARQSSRGRRGLRVGAGR